MLIYWQAYERLSKSRVWSQGEPQVVTVAEIRALCLGMGWSGSEFFETLLDMVQALDEVFVEHVAKKRAASAPSNSDNSAKPVVVNKGNATDNR